MKSPDQTAASRWEAPRELDPGTDAYLRQLLRHCTPCTYYAAYQFRVTGDTERLPTVVTGLLRSQVATDLQAKLGTPDGTLRLREDLGVDSLALTEIGILAEDVLQIAISDVERRGLRTLGDLINLMACKTPVSAAVRTSPGL